MRRFLIFIAALLGILIGTGFTPIIKAGEIGQILKNDRGWFITVTVRDAPTIYGKRIRFIQTQYETDGVELTGKIENGWVEITYPTNGTCDAIIRNGIENVYRSSSIRSPAHESGHFNCKQVKGWILGEFVGITPARRDVIFKAPQQYVVIRDRVMGRLWHNVLAPYHAHEWGPVDDDGTGLSRCCSYTFNKGDRITVWAQSGNWLAIYTINGKQHDPPLFVYSELVEPIL